MREELAGRRRKAFLLRIHARVNRLRAARERDELRARAR
jgi:acyl-coenzyme A thioesterase PaaI-like protein